MPGNTTHMETVLIVEDNADVRLVLQTELEDEYELLMAANGRDGLEMAVQNVPDLVITDIMMPGMSGLELCTELKLNEVTNHIPVIMLTARGKEDEQVEGLEVGANDYISKPFSVPILKMRIRNLLEFRRHSQLHVLKQQEEKSGSEALTIEDRFMQRVTNLTGEHLADPDFGIEQLAAIMSMSPRTLQRKLKAITGQTPQDAVRSIRLNRARSLLENSSLTVSEIAFQVGFQEPSNFSRSFKKQFGLSPTELRREPEGE